VIGVTALRLSAGLVIPFVVSLLVAAGLDPVVRALTRAGVPRWIASALTVAGLVAAIGVTTYSLSGKLNAAINRLPEATTRLQHQFRELRGQPEGPLRALERAADTLEAVASEAAGNGARRVPRATEPALQLRQSLVSGTMTLVGFSGGLVMLTLFVYFVLAAGDLFKRKLVRIAGTTFAQRRTTVRVINDVNRNIERFLWTVVSANLLVGLTTWGAFHLLGLPNALAWGLVAGMLNTIPYFGSAVATVIFFLAGLLHFDTLGMAAVTAGLFLLITTVESTWCTPMILGRTARMNNVAVFAGLLFWGWLWGPWGLLLSFPMLMVLKTIADRVEPLRPFGELLGDDARRGRRSRRHAPARPRVHPRPVMATADLQVDSR
jgi:predicted PurR-regulated permease PerM